MTQETNSSNPPPAGAQSPTGGANRSLVLQIDQHRNHLAILETFHILSDLFLEPSSNLSPNSKLALQRALLRLQFFLIHLDTPILSHSDRAALARINMRELALALDRQADLRRIVHSQRLTL